MSRRVWLLALLLLLAACDEGAGVDVPVDRDAGGGDGGSVSDVEAPDRQPDPAARRALLQVTETASFSLAGLEAEVHVVRTEADVPHVFAESRRDLMRVYGFLVARDRWFMIDLGRRLALGRLSELLGDVVLDVDVTSRVQGMSDVARRLAESLSPEMAADLDAFAEGATAYAAAVRAGTLPPPSELAFAAPLLGAANPADLMAPLTREDIAAFAATVVFQTGFESVDLDHALGLAFAGGELEAKPDAELRRAGIRADIFERVAPLVPISSVGGRAAMSSTAQPATAAPGPRKSARPSLPAAALERLTARLRRHAELLGKGRGEPFGSNAWAVAGAHTAGGGGLLAGDGHLPLTVPTYFYQIGLDTTALGGGDTHVAGLVIPGLPPLAVGTNGRVAWSFTYLYGDLTDWYREEIRLGPDGLPEATRMGDAWMPLARTTERYDIAGVPTFGSVERTEERQRFELFDGRRLVAVEGRAAAPGEAAVDLGDGPIVPADIDGDGVIFGISFDYVGLDAGPLLDAYDALARTDSVEDFRAAHRELARMGSHFAVADSAGGVLSTGYHAAPCRDQLPRQGDRWAEGADPTLILDGTRYGGFRAAGCTVPFEQFPHALNPPRGFVFTANNDLAGTSLDDNLANDPWYLGGPWALGFRAGTIHDGLQALVARGGVDLDDLAALQADHRSPLGRRYVPQLQDALARARLIRNLEGERTPVEARIAALYEAHGADFEAMEARLAAWVAAGATASAGVETFYHAPTEAERAAAVATMVFNTWFGHYLQAVFDDEDLPPVDRLGDAATLVRALDLLLRGRGPGNPAGLASWNPATGESVFFDRVDTPEVERSDELMLVALRDALAFLRAPPAGPGAGGFGTDDPSEWLWGLRHTLRLESLIAAYLTEQPQLAALLSRFSITPRTLFDDLPLSDPRRQLPGFPRPGDNFNVDAAHPGVTGTRFEYRNGPVMRMVIALDGDRVRGRNVLPGGQSGLIDSPHSTDQLRAWLGNEALPLRFHLEEVVEGAVGREVYRPAE